MSKRVALFNNSSHSFKVHRLGLYKFLVSKGYDVHVILPEFDNLGGLDVDPRRTHLVKLSRTGLNPFSELTSFIDIYKVLKTIDPEIAHFFTIKPVIYGSFIAKFLKTPRVICTITGLGYTFSSLSLKAKLLQKLVAPLYRLAFQGDQHRVIFQNPDDMDLFKSLNIVSNDKATLIPGSGVNTSAFERSTPYPSTSQKFVFFCAARLLKDKGILELANACKSIAPEFDFIVKIAGDLDPQNPASLTNTEKEELLSIPRLELLGNRTDIKELLQEAHCAVLPSYREGLPMFLLEALSMGLPIITTDAPGCRMCIIDQENGFICAPQDAHSLKSAMIRFMKSSSKKQMIQSQNSTRLAKQQFSTDVILKRIENLYKT